MGSAISQFVNEGHPEEKANVNCKLKQYRLRYDLRLVVIKLRLGCFAVIMMLAPAGLLGGRTDKFHVLS